MDGKRARYHVGKISESRDLGERNTTVMGSERLAPSGSGGWGRTKFLWSDANNVCQDGVKTHRESCLWHVEIIFSFGDVIGESRSSTTASIWETAR